MPFLKVLNNLSTEVGRESLYLIKMVVLWDWELEVSLMPGVLRRFFLNSCEAEPVEEICFHFLEKKIKSVFLKLDTFELEYHISLYPFSSTSHRQTPSWKRFITFILFTKFYLLSENSYFKGSALNILNRSLE